MHENDLSYKIRKAIFEVYNELGPGLLESVYEAALAMELRSYGLKVEQQKPISATFKGNDLGRGFRADLIVEDKVIIELKSVESLAKVFFKTVLTYLKFSEKKLAILVNFNVDKIEKHIHRVVRDL